MFDIYRIRMNYTLRFFYWYCVLYILYLLRKVQGLSLLEMPVNLSQYRGSVGIFNNRNFFVQSKVPHFSYLNENDNYNNNNNNNNDNNNLAIGLLILLNTIALVLAIIA